MFSLCRSSKEKEEQNEQNLIIVIITTNGILPLKGRVSQPIKKMKKTFNNHKWKMPIFTLSHNLRQQNIVDKRF